MLPFSASFQVFQMGFFFLAHTHFLPLTHTLTRVLPFTGSVSYLMDEHINRFIQRHSLSVGHGQEAEAHADVEPLAHAGAVEGLRLFLGARPLVLLGLTHSCKNREREGAWSR